MKCEHTGLLALFPAAWNDSYIRKEAADVQ